MIFEENAVSRRSDLVFFQSAVEDILYAYKNLTFDAMVVSVS
jgi:hypothetical protein